MAKDPTISYKVYPNERLKPVPFHNSEVYPLYVQVIYDRKPVYFKSYFFDLLSQEKYLISGEKDIHPSMEDIIRKEERLLEHLAQEEQFNLDDLKKNYALQGLDLLNKMDDGFKDYMLVFFADEGQPNLGRIVLGARSMITSEGLIKAFKGSLKPALYNKLIEHAAYYAPPYLPLEAFAHDRSGDRFTTVSIFEWEDLTFQAGFKDFLLKKYPDYTYKEVERQVRNYVKSTII